MKVVIIDDEAHCTLTLSIQLKELFPGFEEPVCFNDPRDGLAWLRTNKADILFLDVEMPHIDGFQLLKSLEGIDFEVIFTTAYNQYVLQAFKVEAVDYLLKPVDDQDLQEAVKRAVKKRMEKESRMQLDTVIDRISKSLLQTGRISLPHAEGVLFVDIAKIIYCQSDGNYTRIFMEGGEKILVTKVLKEIHGMLDENNFLRVHNSYVVNTTHVKRFVRSEGGYLVLTEDHQVAVSRSRKDELHKLM